MIQSIFPNEGILESLGLRGPAPSATASLYPGAGPRLLQGNAKHWLSTAYGLGFRGLGVCGFRGLGVEGSGVWGFGGLGGSGV